MLAWLTQLVLQLRTARCSAIVVMTNASQHVLQQILHRSQWLPQLASTQIAMVVQCSLASIAQTRHALQLAPVRWTSAVHRSMPAWLTQLALQLRTAR